MNGKFFELKKEKQDRMINAALKVFAINGYRHASTDDVVKEAGISKGLLFHYFENKLGVYQFAYDYSVRYMSLELSTFVGSREKDLFEMVKQIQSARLDAMKGYPYMQQFLARSTYEDANEVLMIIGQKKEILENAYQDIYRRIHFNALPRGIDGRLLYQLMNHAADGLIQEHFQEGSFQADMVLSEIMQYINTIKKLVLGS
ncbi:MAG: TetR/AcrR family transcriptional regulator [Lachnospiraceae bacterium]|nr:TetR/AcrR family transcriptional regulator [Lachnospiraceae bacterium]